MDASTSVMGDLARIFRAPLLYNMESAYFSRRVETPHMSDRGILFLFSIVMILAGLASAVWLLVTGQAGTFDGLFLFLTALLVVAVFALYVAYVIRRAMAAATQPAAAPQTAKAAAAVKTPAAKPAPAPAAHSKQPV